MPKVPQASDIQVGSFDIGRAAKIDPGTASYIGRAGDALGDAVGSFGAAFAEVANRANEAQSKQSFVDMQMDYLNKAESEYQDMNKTQSWDTQPQRAQSIFEEQDKSEKFLRMPATDQAKFKLWRFNRTIPYARAAARNYQAQRASEFTASLETYKENVAKKFDLDANPSLNTMTSQEVQSLVDEDANLMLKKIESMPDVYNDKQRAAQTQSVYALSAKIKLDWMKRNDPDHFEELLKKLEESYNPGDVNIDTQDATPDENLNIFENQQELDNTDNLPNFLGGPTKQSKLVPKGADKNTVTSLNRVAQYAGVSPDALSMMINLESGWNTRSKTGSYNGLTQIGRTTFEEAGGKLAGLTYDQFKNASHAKQIEVYEHWLNHYKFKEQLDKFGIDLSKYPAPLQAAFLQGMQFSPNGKEWKKAFAEGNYNVRVTTSKQAKALGSTSIADMARYYANVEGGKTKMFAGNFRPESQPDQEQAQASETTQLPQEIQSTYSKVQELVATEPDTPLVSVLTPDERQSLKTLVPQSVPLDKLTVQDAKVLFEGEAGKQLQQISGLNDQEAAPQRKAMGLGGTELQLDKPIKVADNSLSFSPLELRSLMKDKDALRIMRRDFAEERKAATQINKGTALEMMQNRALNVLRTGEEPDAKTFNPAIVDKAFPSGSKERFFYENLTKDYKQLSDVFKNYGDKPFGQVEAEYRNREPFLSTDKAKALAEKKSNQLQKMMEEDPAQYVEGSTLVKQIRAQFQNGIPKSTEEKTKLIDARLAAQKAIGVPEEGRSPITDAEAATYASTLANTATVEEIVPVMKQIATSVIQNFGKDRSGIVMKYIMKEYLKEREKIGDVQGWLQEYPGNTIFGPPAPTSTTTSGSQTLQTSTSNEEQVRRIMRQFSILPQAGATKPTEDDVMALKNGTMPQREFEKKYNMQPTDAAKYRLYGMRGKP